MAILETDVQGTLDAIASQIMDIKATVTAVSKMNSVAIELNKMTLGALLDLQLTELEPLVSGLEELKELNAKSAAAQGVIGGIIQSLIASHGSIIPSKPHLKLVPDQPPKTQADAPPPPPPPPEPEYPPKD